MQKPNFDELVEQIVAKDPRYSRDAYDFLRAALDFTQKKAAGEKEESTRHVTGQELLAGVRAFALDQFGPMAEMVLSEWGITRCEDFGEIVFNLIDFQVLRKTATDSRDDFKGGFDFESAFRDPFLPPSRLRLKSTSATPASR